MRTATIKAGLLAEGDNRLAASYYVTSDPTALDLVAKIRNTDALGSLCLPNGLFRGPIFRRIFTSNTSFGRPYVTASDLEQAEVRPAVFLSRMHGELLDQLALHQNLIVISCSGVNLGRSFYIRSDTAGLVASHDLIRVVADVSKVRSGYLFAYLDSRFGRSAIRKSTHGGSVRHIEPADLSFVPIPRFTDDEEDLIHKRIIKASVLLANHTARLDSATAVLQDACGLTEDLLDDWDQNNIRLGWREWRASSESLEHSISTRELARSTND